MVCCTGDGTYCLVKWGGERLALLIGSQRVHYMGLYQVYMYMYMYMCTCVCVCACVCACVRACVRVCVYMYTLYIPTLWKYCA